MDEWHNVVPGVVSELSIAAADDTPQPHILRNDALMAHNATINTGAIHSLRNVNIKIEISSYYRHKHQLINIKNAGENVSHRKQQRQMTFFFLVTTGSSRSNGFLHFRFTNGRWCEELSIAEHSSENDGLNAGPAITAIVLCHCAE